MTQEELDKIVEQHQHWLKEDCEGWEEMRAHLEGANLYRANLYRANLYRANLEGANLEGEDLKTLTLSLKREWFDMIKAGIKKEEYR